MFRTKALIHQISKEFSCARSYNNQKRECSKYTLPNFKLRRALVVTKFSRYEFECIRHPQLSKEQLEQKLRARGVDFDMLIYLHNLHKDFEQKVVNSFQKHGCEVKLTNRVEFRSNLSKDTIKWADVIVPVGGDGTFLLAAGRASPLFGFKKTPIVGFNSDPLRSEGRLMLPKYYTEFADEAVARLKSGAFDWMHRTRIRTSLLDNNGKVPESIDLYRHTTTKMEQKKTVPELLSKDMAKKYSAKMKRVLPYLALNEVFIGEQLSARVSHLQLVLNHEDIQNKTKCSGLCVSTGTGSTSWHMSINRVTKEQVEDLVRILPLPTTCTIDADAIVKQYNQNLIFPPDDERLCYSVREQICVGVWPCPKDFHARKFVNSLFVKSNCIDANLVIDGSISYPFNGGAKALLEVYPEDALLTVTFN